MSERERYIPGVPCWVDTSQPDPEAAVQFYGGLFGWEFEDVMPPAADGSYFIGRIRGEDVAAVGSIGNGAEPVAAWNTYIWSDSADAAVSQVTGAGGKVLAEPFDVMGAGRMAVFADPEGAVFNVWQAKQHRGARIVNEPGSLNFNGLNTRDPDAARRFYGEVFGWQTLSVGGGFEAWTLPALWRPPGARPADDSPGDGRYGRTWLRGRRRDAECDRRRSARHPGSLERDVHGR